MAIADQAEAQAAVIAGAVSGIPQEETARRLGISQPQVSRIANRPDVKAQIDAAHKELLDSSLSQAIDNIRDIVAEYPTFKAERDKGFTALSLKFSGKVAESVGIMPGPAPSMLVQHIYNSTSIAITPIVAKLLESHKAALLEPPPEVIDVEYGEG